MADNPTPCDGGSEDEFSPAEGKKVWTTPQLSVQSIVASTHTAANTNSDATFNLFS